MNIEKNYKLKQLCGYIDYNTYNKLSHILYCSSIGMALANDLILAQYPVLNSSVDALACLSITAYLGLVHSKGKIYTKDFQEIGKLYKEVIKKINKLNETFDLNDPIEIHTMFNYLLYKGYLSIDKEFEFSDQNVKDVKGFFGTEIITGKGVCRHISAMLADILNDYGIESYLLGIRIMDYMVTTRILEQQKYTKDELIKWIQTNIKNDFTYDQLMKSIQELVEDQKQNIEFSIESIEEKNLIKRTIANHAITFSIKDGKSYYLDSTMNRIYKMEEGNKKVLCYGDYFKAPIVPLSSIILNNCKDYSKIIKNLSQEYPSTSKDEKKQITSKTITKCRNNRDVFEQFYRENKDLYSDISSKVLKIKK